VARGVVVLLLLAVAGADSADRCVPGQVVVKFVPELRGTLGQAGTDIGGLGMLGTELLRYERLMRRPDSIALARGLDRQYLLVFDPGADVAALVSELSRNPLVEYACPNALLRLDSVPDDTLWPEQWHLPDINAPRAWATAHGDSNVLTAMIADAAFWTHPDLEANIAVNAPEDLNGNRRFDTLPPPAGDLDGIDQDGNGHADDVIGYDFYGHDPIPLPTETAPAGTHCLGVQNAVTDNHIGVAAPPWNVRTYAMRCGDSGYVSVYAAISAIYYCMEQGVWSFSMNFGTYTPYQPLLEACLAAWDAGLIPCASAGHSGGEDPVYPAACEGVVAVAGCGRDHRKTPWSNYGTWIDVTAPGDDIYSTWGPAGYTSLDGNSPACNVVVGVLAWTRSAWPGVSNDSAVRILKNMCDTMPDPLYWQGKLGAGRVRMSTAVTGLDGEPRRSDSGPGSLTVVRGVINLRPPTRAVLMDATGRKVMELRAGANDVRHLAAGVYFVEVSSGPPAGRAGERRATSKVILTD
jgi:subtilisin family serine protease